MRSAPLALAILILPALAIAPGCKQREVEAPPPPPPAKPVSIWTARESHDVAGKLVEAALRESWSSQFRDRNGRPARLTVGTIADRSGKDILVDDFSAAITAAIAAGGGDKLASAPAAEADYAVSGVVTSSAGTLADGAAAVFFAIDLSVAPPAGGDVVWHFAIEQPVATP